MPSLGVTVAQVEFGDCITPDPNSDHNKRSCGEGLDLGPSVDPNGSFTVGPAVSLDPNARTDTLYVTLEGNLNTGGGPGALNTPGQKVQLGILEYSGVPADLNLLPLITFEGVDRVPGFPGSDYSSAGLRERSPAPAAVVNNPVNAYLGDGLGGEFDYDPSPAVDQDEDGRGDDVDNCPFQVNSGQEDAGGVGNPGNPIADGIGNVCQCGDTNGDGSVFSQDVSLIRQILAGQQVPFPKEDLCNAKGLPNLDPGGTGAPLDCEINDVTVILRAISELSPGIGEVCYPAYPPPGN
jgi:hypothetical protein